MVEGKCGEGQNVRELEREEGMSEPKTLDFETSEVEPFLLMRGHDHKREWLK